MSVSCRLGLTGYYSAVVHCPLEGAVWLSWRHVSLWIWRFLFFFYPPSLQVLKPLSETYMEDNVRQTVVNSIKASLTEQVSQRAKLKTHWRSTSSSPLLIIIFISVLPTRSLRVLAPPTAELVPHQSCSSPTQTIAVLDAAPQCLTVEGANAAIDALFFF